jgi:eukaryotic translation initiation factor 2C
MEVCKMIAQKRSKKLTDVMTSEMNAKTCTRPQERARHIHERAVAAEYHNDPYLREFKIACHPQLLEVEGRVLPPPRVQYGTRRMQQENN